MVNVQAKSKPLETRKHEGTVAAKERDTRYSDGLGQYCDNGERVIVAIALAYCDRVIMSCVATDKRNDAGLVGDLIIKAAEKLFGSNGKPPKTIE